MWNPSEVLLVMGGQWEGVKCVRTSHLGGTWWTVYPGFLELMGPAGQSGGLGHVSSAKSPFFVFGGTILLDKQGFQGVPVTQLVGSGHSSQATLNWVWVHDLVIGCFCRRNLKPLHGSGVLKVPCPNPNHSDLSRTPQPFCPLPSASF